MTIIVSNGYLLEDTRSCFSLIGKPNLVIEYLCRVYYGALYQAIAYNVYVLLLSYIQVRYSIARVHSPWTLGIIIDII